MKTIASTLTLIAFGSLAPHAYGDNYFKSGFLVGAHMGLNQNKLNFKQNYFNGPTGGYRFITDRVNTHFSNLFGGLSAGYRHVFLKKMTLSLNVQLDGFDAGEGLAITSDLTEPFKNAYSRSYTVTPSLLMGYIFKPRWHAALELGMPITRFHTELTNPPRDPFKKNRTKAGFMLAGRVEYAVTHHIAVNLSLGHEWYSRLRSVLGPEFTPGVPGTEYEAKARIRTWKGQIGLSYRF